jgi:cytochrome c6
MKRAVFLCLMAVILTSLFAIAGMQQGAAAPASAGHLFKEQCAACHAGGGNIVNPKMPLKGAPLLKTFATFLSQIRKPQAPMPTFSPAQISDEQAKGLYDYILKQNEDGWK